MTIFLLLYDILFIYKNSFRKLRTRSKTIYGCGFYLLGPLWAHSVLFLTLCLFFGLNLGSFFCPLNKVIMVFLDQYARLSYDC
jgi:hypothetical protein